MRSKGFSLIELMVVVAITGMLASVLVPSISGLVDKAKAAKLVAVTDTLSLACESYYSDTGGAAYEYAIEWYPAEGYHSLSFNLGVSGWAGPYIKSPLSRADNPGDSAVWLYAGTNYWHTTAGGLGFDFNGDGAIDTTDSITGNSIVFYNINSAVARITEKLIDGSSINYNTGKAEYYSNYYFTIYLRGGR